MAGSEMVFVANKSHQAKQEILGHCEPHNDSDVQGTVGRGPRSRRCC